MECHLNCFISILIVHVVNDVKSGYILGCKPIHEVINTFHYIIEFEVFACRNVSLWTNLHVNAVFVVREYGGDVFKLVVHRHARQPAGRQLGHLGVGEVDGDQGLESTFAAIMKALGKQA